MPNEPVILEARNLFKRYPFRAHPLAPPRGWVDAVQGFNLSIQKGECVGLVGESGSGKSTVARMLCGLIPSSVGEILFRNKTLHELRGREEREFRKSVQIIFQDPFVSLNPRMRIGQIVAEPLQIHGLARGIELRKRAEHLLREVGLDPSWYNRYPQALSGGQRQRVGIARALALDPELLICDEPVSSLDLSVQAQVLSLLQSLHQDRGLSLLFISHDLRVVGALADRIVVMQHGRVIEEGPNPDLFRQPKHSYTRLLVELAFTGI